VKTIIGRVKLVLFFCIFSRIFFLLNSHSNHLGSYYLVWLFVAGNDWVELHNWSPNNAVNLTGYVLHDDKGPLDEDAFTFTTTDAPLDSVWVLEPQQYQLLCTKGEPAVTPQFGIGGSDTVTLLD